MSVVAGSSREIASRVRAASAPVVVLAGPARTGKTSAVLDLYEQWTGPGPEPGALLLVPGRLAVEQARRAMLDRQPAGVLVSPRVFTFADLGRQILAAAGMKHRPLGHSRRRVALEYVVQTLRDAPADQPGLTALSPVADTPGLVAALDAAIAELKRGAIDPDDLARALPRASAGPDKHRDLLAVYRAYQQCLLDHDLYDTEGLLWLARLALAARPTLPWPGVRAVLVDGFTDFTPTQVEVLGLLGERLDRLVITLPHSQGDLRGERWHWTGRQLNRIHKTFGARCAVVDAVPDDAQRGPVAELADGLFCFDASAPPPAADAQPLADRLSLLAAGGIESECRAIARWAKRHLKAGRAPHELLILARTTEPYAPILSRVFAEARLPAPDSAGHLGQSPVGRFLLALVRLGADFDHADLLAVVGSSFFVPAALGAPADAPLVAQLIVRLGNVSAGRETCRLATERLARRAGLPLADEDDEWTDPADRHLRRQGPDAIAAAGAMLDRLAEWTAHVTAGTSLPEQARRLLELLDRLDLARAAWAGPDEATIAANLRALAAVRGVLEPLADDRLPFLAGRALTPTALADTLGGLLAQTPAPPARAGGAIGLVSALDARALRAAHVWVAGMNEGVFPPRPGDQALLAEGDRRSWVRKGLPLDAREDLNAREMLLFYLMLTRADESVTLSWQYSDSGGKPLERSSFIDTLLAAQPALAERVEHWPAELIPPPERVLSGRDLLNAAFAAAGRPTDAPGAADALGAWHLARRHHAVALAERADALWAAHRRWQYGPLDAFDGLLAEPGLLAELAERVPARTVFSASQLNSYLACPWHYFAQRWLKLSPLAQPGEELLPRSRGLLVHAVLRKLMDLLGRQGLRDPHVMEPEEVAEALDEALTAEATRAEAFGVPYPALWQAELRRVREAVAAYLAGPVRLEVAAQRVAYLELGFGLPAGSHVDPASDPQPLVLPGPAGEVRVRGKIDRVDIVEYPAGRQAAFVVDYKTGKPPSLSKDLQLPLYILAAQQVLGIPAVGGAFHRIDARQPDQAMLAAFAAKGAAFADVLEQAGQTIHQAVAAIAAGHFGLAMEPGNHHDHCPLRLVCGYSPSRAVFKGAVQAQQEGDDE